MSTATPENPRRPMPDLPNKLPLEQQLALANLGEEMRTKHGTKGPFPGIRLITGSEPTT